MSSGLLIAGFDFAGAHSDEFHDWYDLEHLPERTRVPGFKSCTRWIGEENAYSSIATYELDSVGVLDSDAYRAIAYDNLSPWSKRVTSMCQRLVRFEGSQITPGDPSAPANAGALLLNAMNVAAEGEDEFNAWYDEEHIPALAGVPGTLAARRFRSADGRASTHKYIAMYHISSPEVSKSDAWREAVETPWTARVRPFFRDRLRVLATPYQRA